MKWKVAVMQPIKNTEEMVNKLSRNGKVEVIRCEQR